MTIKGLKIVSLNVRSLYTNLNELYARFKDFDILCFCETWLNDRINDQMISMEGFTIFRLDREKGDIRSKKGKPKRGGGLIIYVKNELSQYTAIMENTTSISYNIEKLCIRINKPNVREKIILNVYRPPNGNVAEGVKEMENAANLIQNHSSGELVILGDFNVNYNLRHTSPFKLIKDFERNCNLTQLIKTSTRQGKNSNTCIDLIFTNMDHVISAGVLDVAISDHLPVFMIKKKQKIHSSSSTIRARTYVNYDKTTFQEEIRWHSNWEDFWEVDQNEPDKMWEVIFETIQEVADKHCPFRNMNIREDTPQWLTKEIISEINHKDFLYRKAKKSKNDEDWEIFRQKKNEVKKLLATAKENFIKNKLDELEGNPRKFWREINKISGLGKNKNGRKCTKIADENGKIYENLDAANFLNDYYVNVGPNLAKKHKKEWKKENCKINVETSFSFNWVTETEIKRLIKEICITKSSAIDELSTRILKDAFEILTFELTYLYNACLQSGIFPLSWGQSKVTPIPKMNKNSTCPGDWRPISQIPLPGKILEKIIHAQMTHYFDLNKILSNNQYGFRRERSTSLAIFEVLKNLHGNWNDKNFSSCVFVDFSRAFDTIDHNILAEKLKLYGFDGISLKFIKNYMACRAQKTTVNGHTSLQAPVTYGTAQGSILGPLIFILYVNDIFESLNPEVSTYMYADDTLLVCKSNNLNEAAEKAQNALEEMVVWCEENKLSINLSKTKHMMVKHTRVDCEPQLKIDDYNIGTVGSYEYLGMILDDKLTMNPYLDGMWKKANAKIGILAKIRRFITEKTAVRIYKCMVRPHLDYIDFVIDSGSADRIQRLDDLQKKATRRIEYCIVPENRRNINDLYGNYNIESLKLRRKRNLVKIIYSQSTDVQNLKIDTVKTNLRSKNKVRLKNDFTSKTRVFNSPLYRGLRLWDSLPSDLQKEKDSRIFKKRIAKYCFKECIT